MVQTNLGQQALKAQARGDALAALTLILIDHDDPVRCPPPGRGPLDQGILPSGRLHVVDHLLRMGLAHIHHGQSSQMMVAELGAGAADVDRLAS